MFYLVLESGTRQKLVPDCMTHVPDSGTSFLIPVSGQYVMGITTKQFVSHFFNQTIW